MSNDKPITTTTAVQKADSVEFVPFGAEDKIKLSIAIVKNLVCNPTKSGQICSDREAMKFMMLCKSRALNPWEGDCWLIGYDGKNGPEFSLITAHQAFLKRAELHPEYDGMESGVIVSNSDGGMQDLVGDFVPPDSELIGAWATVHFKNRKYPMRERLNLRTFNKGFGRWNDDPAGQIVKCAEASALRRSFPTKCGGMYLKDEIGVKSEAPTLADVPSTVEVVSGPAETPKEDKTSEVKSASPARQQHNNADTPQGQPSSPQEKLQQMIETAGFTFPELMAWAEESGNLKDASSFPDYAALPTAEAMRWLRAKAGVLDGIKRLKGVAQ